MKLPPIKRLRALELAQADRDRLTKSWRNFMTPGEAMKEFERVIAEGEAREAERLAQLHATMTPEEVAAYLEQERLAHEAERERLKTIPLDPRWTIHNFDSYDLTKDQRDALVNQTIDMMLDEVANSEIIVPHYDPDFFLEDDEPC